MGKLTEWYNRLLLASEPREPDDVAAEDDARIFEFTAWPKTPRLFRDVVVTEKIDGTNAAVLIADVTDADYAADDSVIIVVTGPDGRMYAVGAQSRNRVITLAADNQGFARWVEANAVNLVADLGPGHHFGEFYGQKIARNYGLTEKRFALFNPSTKPKDWTDIETPDLVADDKTWRTDGLHTVPVLYEGPFDTAAIRQTLADLSTYGSAAVPGWDRPEGIVVYHTHARQIIGKVTLDNHDAGKWEVHRAV